MTKRLVATATVAVLLLAGAPRARADEATAIARAAGMWLGTILVKGFSGFAREDSGVLRPGQFYRYPVTLYRGRRYALFAAGDNNINDLDVYLYDEDGDLVVSDDARDNMPGVFFAPAYSGLYYLVVLNYDGDRGWYHMAIAY